MTSPLLSRRALALRLAAVPAALCAAARAPRAADAMVASVTPDAGGLSRSSESIHQEVRFDAGRGRVFEALTSSTQFDAVTRLSDALALVTAPGAKSTSISPEVGGPFTLFGGYITGRNLELLREQRLVQAWRTVRWKAGDYSIVKFVLVEDGAATQLIFDHRGFPEGEGSHLAEGWHVHYWEPLSKYLHQT